jgi:hypothetical protein
MEYRQLDSVHAGRSDMPQGGLLNDFRIEIAESLRNVGLLSGLNQFIHSRSDLSRRAGGLSPPRLLFPCPLSVFPARARTVARLDYA